MYAPSLGLWSANGACGEVLQPLHVVLELRDERLLPLALPRRGGQALVGGGQLVRQPVALHAQARVLRLKRLRPLQDHHLQGTLLLWDKKADV